MTVFPLNYASAIIDYGLKDVNTGPFLASTLWTTQATIHDKPFASSLVIFSLNTANGITTLRASCTGLDTIIITFNIRALSTNA